MIKVYIPSFKLCIFSLIINCLFLGIPNPRVSAQNLAAQQTNRQEDNTDQTELEPAILSEINRVRTDPQGYAQWLQEQRQYYDGVWLKLPGEKPIRTNRGLKALEEAIAILKNQQPLSPLDTSEQILATANNQLENFATANNIQNISYGRVTAKGIVMSLVVDELFPDRRRRNSLLSPDFENTGVVCKPDPRYAKVCAIAYSDSATSVAQVESQSNAETAENEINSPQESPATLASEVNPDSPADSITVQSNNTEQVDTEKAETDQEAETAALPDLPLPSVPANPGELPSIVPPTSEVDSDSAEEEIAISPADIEEQEELEEGTEELAEEQGEDINDDEESAAEEELDEEELEINNGGELALEGESEDDNEEELEAANNDQDPEDIEVIDVEIDNSEDQVATASDSSRLLENVERGSLEEGDRIIEDDGSFYDSYPLEGKAGESFIIYLESDEFDAFVALIDDQGNIIEQNDDISEDNSNARIRVTIPENGIYNVIVNAYDEGGKGRYILTVRR